MRNPRSSKTEGEKNATAENSIIQRMKNLVMRSFSEVKAPSIEFNFVCYRQAAGSPGGDCGGVLSLRFDTDCYFREPLGFCQVHGAYHRAVHGLGIRPYYYQGVFVGYLLKLPF